MGFELTPPTNRIITSQIIPKSSDFQRCRPPVLTQDRTQVANSTFRDQSPLFPYLDPLQTGFPASTGRGLAGREHPEPRRAAPGIGGSEGFTPNSACLLVPCGGRGPHDLCGTCNDRGSGSEWCSLKVWWIRAPESINIRKASIDMENKKSQT